MALYTVTHLRPQIFPHLAYVRYVTKISLEREYKKSYKVLNLPENSSQDAIRKAYIALAKRYHPDSGSDEADSEKFHHVDKAFRLLMEKKTKENPASVEVEEQDIKHTAPQHRHYLTYEGIGAGTPFEREKQHAKARATKAADDVLQHRIAKKTAEEKALLVKTPLRHDIKTKYGYERLVEDLIQEGMSKGLFDNLKGAGKPLSTTRDNNPYVDFVTHKMNEILIDNGFTPEWITLQKEIRHEIEMLRNTLCRERTNFSPYPLSIDENIEWSNAVYKHKPLLDAVNLKINKYNLLVPLLDKQMLQVSLKKEAQSVLLMGKSNKDVLGVKDIGRKQEGEKKHDLEEHEGFLGIFESIFRKSS